MDDDDDQRRHWIGLLIPAATFLVGLVLGGALIYANSGGDAAGTSTPTPSVGASPTSGSGDTVVTVPAACDEAARKVGEAYTLLRQAVSQVRDFQADQLVDTLNQLEDVDAQTRPLVDACNKVSVTTSPSSESSPE